MQTKVRIKLSEHETRHIEAMSRTLGITLEELTKKSLITTVNKLYEEAFKLSQQEAAQDEAERTTEDGQAASPTETQS